MANSRLLVVLLAFLIVRAASAQTPAYEAAPAIKKFLASIDDVRGPGNALDRMTPESVRELWFTRELGARSVLTPISVGSVRDICVPSRNHQIPVRIYAPSKTAKPPVLVYIHGGGWTLGSIATYDSVARALTNKIPAMVVSVDYRLAPEHPFPAGLEDVHLAVEWVARNAEEIGGDPNRIALAGDSGGATLATVVALKAKQEKIPIVFQALFYPCTNISRTDSASYKQFGENHLLTKKAVESFRAFYLPSSQDWQKPEVSPLLMKDEQLRQMPTALIMTAGCDPLREEGKAYKERLCANGVRVIYREKNDMIHAFLNFFNTHPDISKLVEPIIDEAATEIRKSFAANTGH